jgi:hypothetical protein
MVRDCTCFRCRRLRLRLGKKVAIVEMRFLACPGSSEGPAWYSSLVRARATRRYAVCGVRVILEKVNFLAPQFYPRCSSPPPVLGLPSTSHGELKNWTSRTYTPRKKCPARIDFYNTLRGRLSSNTIVGGDWNTVTDVTLDVRSRNPLGYQNRGASQLATVMGELGLTDERREQLGDEREYTRTADDGSISTRLDR